MSRAGMLLALFVAADGLLFMVWRATVNALEIMNYACTVLH